MRSFSVAIIASALLVPAPGVAQIYGSDPYGWSRQSNAAGFRQACNSARERYRSFAHFYNNARTPEERREWQREMTQAMRDIERYCNR